MAGAAPGEGPTSMNPGDHRQRLAAILAADAAGYSRLMELDERDTVRALDAARAVFRERIEANGGRIVNTAGDSVLALFDTAAGAVAAALEVQRDLAASAGEVPEDRRMRFRIGVHLGDVIEQPDGDVYGDGVNIAARLQAIAAPGGIVVSEAVRGAVKNRVATRFDDLGAQSVKNIADPLRAFAVGDTALAPPARQKPRARRWAFGVAAAAAVLAAIGVVAWKDRAAPASAPSAAGAPEPVSRAAGKPSIAVLPFDNMSGDADKAYFADGMTEDIITDLSKVAGLTVIARNSSFQYKG
ncbi:MAG TPA: adenylate/guanylate cyclase domain-containing protein, partial [Casimicrobiaceae bacterium]